MNKAIFFSLAILFLLLGCSRDDLCSSETPKTPLLIIRFYSAENPAILKEAEGFTIVPEGDSIALFAPQTIDSIAIPLDTRFNFTDYLFYTNANDSIPNVDIVGFTYNRKDEFINRACAFRTNFDHLEYTLSPTQQGWINSILVINDTVNIRNQHAPHLHIYH